MQTPSQIIDELGGVAFVASALAVPYTTVHHWHRKQTLPRWRCSGLLALAESLSKTEIARAIENHAAVTVSPAAAPFGTQRYLTPSVPNGDA